MTQQCHWCGTVENLKSRVCNGDTCGRGQEHGTSICRDCYVRTTDFNKNLYDTWNDLTYHLKPKLKTFDADKMYSDIVHYYVDKKGYALEKAEEIAKQKIQEQKALRGIS